MGNRDKDLVAEFLARGGRVEQVRQGKKTMRIGRKGWDNLVRGEHLPNRYVMSKG